MATFDERLRQLRKESGMHQKDLIEITGASSQQVVSSWEKGATPDISKVMLLAKHFGVTVEYLLGKSDYRTASEEFIDKLKKAKNLAIKFNARGRIEQLIADIQNEYLFISKIYPTMPPSIDLLLQILGAMMDTLERAAEVADRQSFMEILQNDYDNKTLGEIIVTGSRYITANIEQIVVHWMLSHSEIWQGDHLASPEAEEE